MTQNNITAADTDVAINIFSKPFQTALSLLSLLKQSRPHIREIWLQFEPAGSKFDVIPAYYIATYLGQTMDMPCHVSQPEHWQARTPADPQKFSDAGYRMGLRYQHAFENSSSPFLFIMHNDVFIYKDVIGALKQNIDDAFCIGSLGQCWNCPASNADIMREVMGTPACGPDRYLDCRPNFEQLQKLYKKAREKNIFARPYDKDNFSEEFEKNPWPLPECRVNEWALLINLRQVRPLCVPYGDAWPPGAFRDCSSHNLDVVTPFFRDLHTRGLKAKNLPVESYLKHWVGTGNKSKIKYAYSEDRAKRLLQQHFPDYMTWLEKSTGKKFS